jgi:hypothetical protein
MKNPSLLILSAVILAALAAACGGGGSGIGECDNNGDCEPSFLCKNHKCMCTDAACAADPTTYCNDSGSCQKWNGCQTDADCTDATNYRCLVTAKGSGTCMCRNDQACAADEFCNTNGQCQKKTGCISASDCPDPANFRCQINEQTMTGECLCTNNAACQATEFCNPKGYCQPLASCTKNEDCPASKYCKVETGECLCQDNAGCLSTEVCNASGYCQPRPGCFDNRDCVDIPNTYCDFETRTCVAVGTCNADYQCPIGQVCAQHACQVGCRSSQDCDLDEYCNGSYACVAGCQGDSSCEPLQFCRSGTCQDAYTTNDPYCKACDGLTSACGDAANWCIVYPYANDGFGSDNYCGPSCASDADCPNGMGCGELQVIYNADNPFDPICTTDGECPTGVPCWKDPETPDKGYCPCHDQRNPCPANTCNTLYHQCTATGKACTSNANCTAVSCEYQDANGLGACIIGASCGVNEGIHCPPGHP